jgi:hypothetical protein
MNTRGGSYIFISYCRADSNFAQRLVRSLEEAGLDIWIDAQELKAGDSLLDQIHLAIGSASFFLILLSPHSVNSKWVQQELKFAFTRQLKSNERFVLPLLVANCEIPTFLQDRVYVDFSNRRKFNVGVAKLLKAIDENMIKPAPSVSPVVYPDQTTIEALSKDPDFAHDEWFNEYKNMALVQDGQKAISYGSFGGQFRTDLRVLLAFASNDVSGRNFNNLLALVGFSKDISDLIKKRHDLQQLYKELVEDLSLSVEYRGLLLRRLLEALDDVPERVIRLATLPQLFRATGFDPLSTVLVSEFFDQTGNSFSKLWHLASSRSREEMTRYMAKVGVWEGTFALDQVVYLHDNSKTALARAAMKWKGISSLQPTPDESTALLSLISNVEKETPVSSIVEAFERLSAVPKGGMIDRMINITNKSFTRTFIESRGPQCFFELNVGLIASPYVDCLVSTMCLLSLVNEAGGDSLRFHDAFPTALMRKKEQGLFPHFSIVDGLVDSLAADALDAMVFLLLVKLLQLFHQEPFRATVAIAIKRIKKPNASLKILLKDAYREVTYTDLETFFQKNFPAHRTTKFNE